MGEGGQEGLGQGQRQAGQLAVHGPHLARDPVPLDGVEDGPAAAALVPGQGVGEDPHELGEGELVLVAAAAVPVEQVAEDRIAGDVPPDGVERLGQRQSTQHVSGEGGRGGLDPSRHGDPQRPVRSRRCSCRQMCDSGERRVFGTHVG